MKNHRNPSSNTPIIKGRPDYYLTPTRDFTQYTKDSEEKYWSQDTKFDWQQSVQDNLKKHLDNLDNDHFLQVSFMVLPMIRDTLIFKINQIEQERLPLEEEGLKDIAACVPKDRDTIHQALLIQAPLKKLHLTVRTLKDRLEIQQSELLDLREQQRLGLFNNGSTVKYLATEAERKEQQATLAHLTDQIRQTKEALAGVKIEISNESRRLKTSIQEKLNTVETQVLKDLELTLELVQNTLDAKSLPENQADLLRLKDLILQRQLRGLKDIANHALVVEQSAIAPLTMGIIHYKRYREIQEAMTTFINDEAKHSATFRRFLAEKLDAKEFIPDKLIKGANSYMWLARFLPGTGVFLAVIVEAIGAAYLEFFGKEEYMPDPLFCSICKTISEQDEKRHMDLCVAMYNELFRKGHRWEQFRNRMALKVMMKSVYGDKTDDHHLIQAFLAFGVPSEKLYLHIVSRLSQQLARISLYISPDELLEIIGRKR